MSRRDTLVDFFSDLATLNGEFLVWDDGYRTHSYTYSQIAGGARAFAAKLRREGVSKGCKIVLWSENRPEWVAALWGCLLEGVIAVPIDFRSSAEFVRRVAGIVEARAILVGESVNAADLSPPPEGRGSVQRDGGAARNSDSTEPRASASGSPLLWRFSNFAWGASGPLALPSTVSIGPDDIAQVVFTSGATAEPKGVLITHRNILSNIVPVETEVRKYRRYERPFHPIRFLNLLPLSHLFGQTLATFIPPMIAGTVVFQSTYHPGEIVRQIHARRISVLVSVPKILEVLRDYILVEFPETAQIPNNAGFPGNWWRFRRVHRAFGFKFWAVITGAAPLDPEVETFFRRLGFVVIQGYGLTETAPIVTVNHPFHTRAGSVGTPVGGVEVKLAGDGEVLVRGGNVSRGYYGIDETEQRSTDGWLQTGDIGELDSEGRLTIRGRKKEMIVLADGRKVFPEDVEAVLRSIPGVRDCAVIGPDQVHAVLVLSNAAEAERIVGRANERLEDQQKIRAISVWPAGDELPRTAGTAKLKRTEIAARIAGGAPPPSQKATGIAAVLQRYAPGRTITQETTLDELGLSSLDRIQLLTELEQLGDTAVDESSFTAARTVADLSRPASAAPVAGASLEYPLWNRSWWARGVRSVVQWLVARPLTRYYARITVTGAANLNGLSPPVIFAPNHQSFMDVPAVLCALPREWRSRIAPAMAKEWFEPHFHPSRFSPWRRFTSGLQYYAAALFFNAFPIPQREMGARRTLRYMGSLMDQGRCVLIFPEGDRTHSGELHPFRPGTAVLAAQTKVPVVPVRLEGLERVFHRDAHWPSHGPVKVTFGPALTIEGDDYPEETKRIEAAVRALGSS